MCECSQLYERVFFRVHLIILYLYEFCFQNRCTCTSALNSLILNAKFTSYMYMQNETNTYFFLEIRPNISTTGMEKQVYKLFLLVPVIFNTGIYNIRMKCRKKADNLHFIRPSFSQWKLLRWHFQVEMPPNQWIGSMTSSGIYLSWERPHLPDIEARWKGMVNYR